MPASTNLGQVVGDGAGGGGQWTEIFSQEGKHTPFSLILNLAKHRSADSGWPHFRHRDAQISIRYQFAGNREESKSESENKSTP